MNYEQIRKELGQFIDSHKREKYSKDVELLYAMKTEIKEAKKKRVSNKELYEFFKNKGFDLAYPTFCTQIAKIRKDSK